MIEASVEHFLTQVCGGLSLTFLYVAIFFATITAITALTSIFYFSSRESNRVRRQFNQKSFVNLDKTSRDKVSFGAHRS